MEGKAEGEGAGGLRFRGGGGMKDGGVGGEGKVESSRVKESG